jgi:hypothetical protein
MKILSWEVQNLSKWLITFSSYFTFRFHYEEQQVKYVLVCPTANAEFMHTYVISLDAQNSRCSEYLSFGPENINFKISVQR